MVHFCFRSLSSLKGEGEQSIFDNVLCIKTTYGTKHLFLWKQLSSLSSKLVNSFILFLLFDSGESSRKDIIFYLYTLDTRVLFLKGNNSVNKYYTFRALFENCKIQIPKNQRSSHILYIWHIHIHTYIYKTHILYY